MKILNFTVNLPEILDIRDESNNIFEQLKKIGFVSEVKTQAFAIHKNAHDHICVLNGRQILYKVEKELNENDFKECADNIESILKLCRFDNEQLTFAIRFIELYDMGFDMLNFTKTKTALVTNKNIMGVGYRCFFQYMNAQSEIKIEPWLRDNKYMYFDALYNLEKYGENINSMIGYAYNNFKEMCSEMINNVNSNR